MVQQAGGGGAQCKGVVFCTQFHSFRVCRQITLTFFQKIIKSVNRLEKYFRYKNDSLTL